MARLLILLFALIATTFAQFGLGLNAGRGGIYGNANARGPYGNGPYGNANLRGGPYGNGPYGNANVRGGGPYGNGPYGNANVGAYGPQNGGFNGNVGLRPGGLVGGILG